MCIGIDYSSLTMQTCLLRCSRLKGQFVLHILLNKAALVVNNVMQRFFKTNRSVHNGLLAEVDACKQ